MITGTGDYSREYRLSDTTYGKYDSGFHAYLVECCDPDDYFGDTDFGGCTLYGRRIDEWDTRGFHSLVTFPSSQEALESFQKALDEFYAPEWEDVEMRDYRDAYRVWVGRTEWTDDDTYTRPDFRGVALRVYGPMLQAGYSRGGDTEYRSTEDHNVVVCMVGDDTLYRVSEANLTAIPDDEYCSSCGQVGCGWH